MASADSAWRLGADKVKVAATPSLEGPADSALGFETLFDAIPTPILVLDRESLKFLHVNDAALKFYGYTPEEFRALHLSDIRPERVPGEIEGMIARFDDPDLPETPRMHVTKAGAWRIVKVNARIIELEGRPAILAAVFDMTREQELQRDLRSTKAFLRNMVDGVPIAMFAKNAATGQYVFFNSAAEELFGYPRADLLGRVASEVFSTDEAAVFVEQDRQALASGATGITTDAVVEHPHRGKRCIRMKKVVVGDDDSFGNRYILAVGEDVTEERKREAHIAHRASHDGLTGLANRWLFQQRLAEIRLSGRGAADTGIAVHYIDLDGFKSVNDSWGHKVGDGVLVEAARRMEATVRDGDMVARFGGDEFGILQIGLGDDRAAKALAERLVMALGEPYLVDGHVCDVGASVGVAIIDPDMPIDDIVEDADRALYAAKRRGKGRSVLWCLDDMALDDMR